MKIDIRDFFENYEDTEIELQSDRDFDAEKIIRMTRRELRKKTLRRVATGLAAAAALLAIVFAAGFGVSRETNYYEPTQYADGKRVSETKGASWIWDLFGFMKSKKIGYGDQGKEPGMDNWDSNRQGLIMEFEAETESDPENTEGETESQAPAYLEGPEVGEEITLVAIRYGYLPQSERKSKYQALVAAKEKLEYWGYSEEEISSAWGEENLTTAYTYVTREAGVGLDYMIDVLQPYEVETRTFSFEGEVTIVKNDVLGEWEATWLTVDQNRVTQESEAEYEEMPEEAKEVWKDMDHHLLLYHPTKHYLINLSVDSTVFAMEELDKMAADIVVVEAEMETTTHINEVINFPNQTFNLNAVQG
ncbi:MAG: hypothetical protein IKU11_01610 [Clostridia bacterium]|nr:hypothetical protein [Clostridia bacterium]